MFGVKDVVSLLLACNRCVAKRFCQDVSEDSRGKADINREFIAADNGFFVLHDSVGLEAGESNSLEKVKHFIDARRKEVNVKNKLHAVW